MEKLAITMERDECGLWFATSPDDPGLFVAAKTMEGLFVEIHVVLAALRETRAALAKEQSR